MILDKYYDIYRQPNSTSIWCNITNKQHLLINRFFDMSYVVATADSSIVFHNPIKMYKSYRFCKDN